MDNGRSTALLVGRVLIALIFVLSGLLYVMIAGSGRYALRRDSDTLD